MKYQALTLKAPGIARSIIVHQRGRNSVSPNLPKNSPKTAQKQPKNKVKWLNLLLDIFH